VTRPYRRPKFGRLVNKFVQAMIRLNIGPQGRHTLLVQGRRSGKWYSTPVTIVEEGGHPWLVAPYGEVAWVRDARAAGRVTLTRGQKAETLEIVQVGPAESAPMLKMYLAHEPITRPYFTVPPDAALEDFAAEAPRHPVFRLTLASDALD
jgi:hypothetical protein